MHEWMLAFSVEGSPAEVVLVHVKIHFDSVERAVDMVVEPPQQLILIHVLEADITCANPAWWSYARTYARHRNRHAQRRLRSVRKPSDRAGLALTLRVKLLLRYKPRAHARRVQVIKSAVARCRLLVQVLPFISSAETMVAVRPSYYRAATLDLVYGIP